MSKRHILGISGGKDSTALAIHIKNTRPDIFDQLELFFTDTGTELPETYEYLDKIEQYLGKPIVRLKTDGKGFIYADGDDTLIPFDMMLEKYNGFLPAPNARWCTREMKIKPMEAWIGGDSCYSYIGLRADEPTREGYQQRSGKNDITPVYPFREDGLGINEIYAILDNTIGLPRYYLWRTRSGCYFCFYQRRVEWAIMYLLYPEWFEKAKQYETQHEDGRQFTWVKDKPLDYVEQNAVEIVVRYIKKQVKKMSDVTRLHFPVETMIAMVENGQMREVVDMGDIKKLHDVDGENKDGCTVCAI